MMDWSSDSDDGDKFEWETDGDAEPLSASALSNLDASGPYALNASGGTHGEAPSSSLVEEYVGKGFPKEMVLKAIKAIGNNDANNALCELLLTYKALGDYPLVGKCSTSSCTSHNVEDDDEMDLDFENWDDDDDHVGEKEANSDGSIAKDWSSDSDGGEKIEWESDGEAEPLSAVALSKLYASGPSTLDANGWTHGEALSSSLVEKFVGKGFPKDIVFKAIKAIGNNDANALHELLLAYKALGDFPLDDDDKDLEDNYSTSNCTPQKIEDDNDKDLDFGNWDDDNDGEREANSDGSMDWSSDSDGGEKIDWESDGEAEPLSAAALSNIDASGPSTLDANGWSHGEALSSSLVEEFVGKGFPKEIVFKAIKAIGNNDANALRELLLAYKALGDCPLVGNYSTSGSIPHNIEDDDDDDPDFGNWDEGDCERETKSDSSIVEDFKQEMLEKDKKIKSLVDTGFSEDEPNMINTRRGVGASFFALDVSKFSDHEVMNTYFNSFGGREKERFRKENKTKRKRYGDQEQGNQPPVDGSHDEPMVCPNPMVGFSLPNRMVRSVNRRLPRKAIGPPFFYYENVALAPKGVWRTISRKLYGVEPETVDSKHFCAAVRKRRYIHNLPIENRAPLLPESPKTILEAFPHYKKWWPSWDSRRKLNCLTTCVRGTKLAEEMECALEGADDPPSPRLQKYVMDGCKDYNLVWVGKNKVAPLEAHEMEKLLGFPKDHTRGVGITERCKSLGNSFQVNTVAYHLSVLRDMFPNGIKVLSLFTGIGGGEVALHRLGIHLRIVVSVEISKVNRRIFRGWWNQTQTGRLIEIFDVESLTNDEVESLTRKFGGFDLVIGGSPCNNLAGKNRFHRDGLEGEHSALFHHYFRILDAVKSVMARM